VTVLSKNEMEKSMPCTVVGEAAEKEEDMVVKDLDVTMCRCSSAQVSSILQNLNSKIPKKYDDMGRMFLAGKSVSNCFAYAIYIC